MRLLSPQMYFTIPGSTIVMTDAHPPRRRCLQYYVRKLSEAVRIDATVPHSGRPHHMTAQNTLLRYMSATMSDCVNIPNNLLFFDTTGRW